MRRNSVIARVRKLGLAFAACLMFSVLAPMFFAERRSEEHFAGSSVLASPRDRLELTVPVKLSDTPDLTLVRGIVSDYGPAAAGGTMSHLVLEAPVFSLNAAAVRASSKSRCIRGMASGCRRGSPPVSSTNGQFNARTASITSSSGILRPPEKA